MKLSRLFFLSFIIWIFLSPRQTFAQEQTPPERFDATVSPVFFDFNAKPGQVISDKIRVRNNTTETRDLIVKIKLLGGDENGELTVKEEIDDALLSWISVKNTTVKALPKEWVNIPFTITVPKEAAYGYYWAFSINTIEDNSKNFTGAKLNASLVVPILLNVNKIGAKTEGKIVSFTKDIGWYEYLPVKFNTTFQNSGNVHIKPKGNIFIKDFMGRQVAVLNVNQNLGAILPQTKRDFESIWSDSFIFRVEKFGEDGKVVLDDKGKAKTELKFRFDKILDLRIGKYTATSLVVLSTDTRDIAFEKSISFFVFPWKIVIASIVFVIFALLGFANTTKTITKRVKEWFGKGKK